MKRTHIVAGLVAGLTAGAGAGFILTDGGAAGAAARSVDAAVTVSTDVATGDTGTDTGDADTGTGTGTDPAGREDHIRDALAPLVEQGTLTEAQVDAVVAALGDVLPGGGHGGRGGGHGGRGSHLDAAATALGLEAQDLMSQLADGSTIAEIAATQGVDVQTVVDAMVAEVGAHLDEEVTEGDLTQAEADAALAEATTEITTMVNDGWTFPAGMGDGHGGMGHGHGGGSDDDGGATTDDGVATTDTASI